MSTTHGGSEAALAAGQSAAGKIRERPDGFTVTLVKRPRVKVRRRATHFEVESRGHQQRVALTERQLKNAIVDGLMAGWRPPSGLCPPARWPPKLWVVAHVRRFLADPVKAQCDRLLQTVDPNVPAVHQALSAVTSTPCALAMCPELYHHPYLVSDIINYRAAAIVAADKFEDLVCRARRMRVDRSPELADFKTFAAAHGAEVTVHIHPVTGRSGSPHGAALSLQDALTCLRGWRDLLSPSGHSYRSLDRTLMNLPRGVPARLVCLLNRITLPRPLTDRLELLLVTLYVDRYDRDRAQQQVFVTARAPQIREALRRVAAHTRNDLRVTRQRDLRFLIGFLLDVPGHHAGTIVGLADKAIRWHQQQLAQERARVLARYGAQTRVKMPPIPVPADASVRRLETVADIVEEGERMGHCVASCVPEALRGGCYLFHVEHAGDAATVMVDHKRVVEALGPRNQSNEASRWGAGRLATWARGLRRADIQHVG